MKPLFSVLLQFINPSEACLSLKGEGQTRALAGTAFIIMAVGLIPFIIQGDFSSESAGIILLILLERVILSGAAGLAVYALSFALSGKNPLWPAVASSFLSMGAFMILIAVLTVLSYLLKLPGNFSWSPAEILPAMQESRLSVFTVLFLSRLDIASLATVYLWGRGLSSVWNTDVSTGQRMAWTVYLFGILLITLPVFIATPGTEGAQ